MSKTQEYIEEYNSAAKEQMKRYGIPASVTLAQGILESANGESQVCKECNNHFGIKASDTWIRNGGQYKCYTDDRPNEKFCLYGSVNESFEHHSKVLSNSKRYSACFKLSPDDYKGWTQGLQNGGYATNKKYAESLQNIIEKYGLQKYDQEVMSEMKAQGKAFGVDDNPLSSTNNYSQSTSSKAEAKKTTGNTGFCLSDGEYSLPLKRNDFLLVTSPYGKRTDPMNRSKSQFHQGIDINARHDAVLATECNGKVVKANNATNTGGGKTVIVEYDRGDGTKTQCLYMHLSEIDVNVGDTVKAGQQLGISGNTGTRTTGEHLHFGVRNVDNEGKQSYVDPAAYLTEISAHGHISTKALHNGKNLMAKYTASNGQKNEDINLTTDDWMKTLMSSEDFGLGSSLDGGNGGMLEMAFVLFSSLMTFASQFDARNEEEKMEAITDAVLNKKIDITSLTSLKLCTLNILDNGKMYLQIDNGNTTFKHELSDNEAIKLQEILSSNLDDDAKRQKITNMMNGIVISQQASQNYEEIAAERISQQQSQQRK